MAKTTQQLINDTKLLEPNQCGNKIGRTRTIDGDVVICELCHAGSHSSAKSWGRMNFWIVPQGDRYRKRFSKSKAKALLG